MVMLCSFPLIGHCFGRNPSVTLSVARTRLTGKVKVVLLVLHGFPLKSFRFGGLLFGRKVRVRNVHRVVLLVLDDALVRR